MQTRSERNLKGIDISHWQGEMDFFKIKSNGIKVVYIKATEGLNCIDNHLTKNYEGAKAQGLLVGFYHYFKPSVDARAQGRFFVNSIGKKKYDCRLALDIEVTDGLKSEDLTAMCITFLEEVKKLTGKEVVVYTYTSFANTSLNSKLAVYPLWVAHYNVTTPGLNKIWNDWIGFQYTDLGRITGINGRCDLNEFTEEIIINTDNSVEKSLENISIKSINYRIKREESLAMIANR